MSLVALAAAMALASPQDAGKAGPVVSVHTHLGGKKGRESDFPGAIDAAVKMMDESGYALFVVMPMPQPPNAPSAFDVADFADLVKKQPKRFAFLGGGGTLNAMIQQVDAKDVTDDVKTKFDAKAREILDAGAVGFGEMSALHLSHQDWHPYECAPPDHPLFLRLADLAADRDVVIDLHLDPVVAEMPLPEKFKRSKRNPGRLAANVAALERLLDHNPKAKIVWDHVGWDQTGDGSPKLIRSLMEKHANLYASLATSGDCVQEHAPLTAVGDLRPDWLDLLKDYSDRFMIGCDVFACSPKLDLPVAKAPCKPRLEGPKTLLTKLPEDVAKKIAHENAEKLFKLGLDR